MERSYGDLQITPELLEELKRKALILEDELAIEGGRVFEATGRLNDPAICKMGVEYENLNLDIEKLERLLKETQTAETAGEKS
ncbi:MAG: hypothetical protein E7330_07535 [Clostridiales bacterium]|nr:hypothetical protein [Clostridiales bacterium]